MKNKYYRRSRIPLKTFERLVQGFAKDLTATQTARQTNVSVRSVNSIYLQLRGRITQQLEREWKLASADRKQDIKVSRRPVYRPCKQDGQKILVLVLSQLAAQINLAVAPDARKNKPLMARKNLAQVNTQDDAAEQIWSYLDKRLSNFRGVPEATFELHVKETAFRFNHQDDLYQTLLSMLEESPL